MTAADWENTGTDDAPRPLPSEQAALPQTGDSGVVETHGGTTSLGTTPIGLGSVGPVQQHQRAAEMIMGETDAAGGAATAADTDDRGMQARAAARPVGGERQGGLSGILKKVTEPRSAAIMLGLVVVAIAIAAFASRRRQ
jgi:hypothetical protein